MRMIKPFHQSNFTPDTLFPLNVFNFLFFIDFKCNFFIQFLMHSNTDNSICSLAYLLAYDIVTETVLVGEDDLFLGDWRSLRLGGLLGGPYLGVSA
jgi:hypothetical protein